MGGFRCYTLWLDGFGYVGLGGSRLFWLGKFGVTCVGQLIWSSDFRLEGILSLVARG